MQSNDLTKVSGIGQSRAKYLAEHGILTVEDLKKLSVEELASIKTIGIKNAETILSKLNIEAPSQPPVVVVPKKKMKAAPRAAKKPPKEVKIPDQESTVLEEIIQMMDPKTFKIVRKAQGSLNDLQNVLESGLEKLKPLGKKKLLKEYVTFKVHAKKLDKNLKKVVESLEEMPKNATKGLYKASEELKGQVKGLWKQMKKKKFTSVNQEMEAFRKLIKTLKQKK